MVEEQALARIHRIGQTKKVKTIRYLVRNSFEEVRDSSPSTKGMEALVYYMLAY
jgi:SNF2 family DNA or RNA helicase